MVDRNERSLTELRSEAKAQGIRGYSRMTKDELLRALGPAAAAADETTAAAAPAKKKAAAAPKRAAHTAAEAAHHEGRFPGAGAPGDAGRYAPDMPGPLPTSYGEDRLVLMARDPEWLFAYWEIRPETAQQAMRDLEESVPVLRVSYRPTEGRSEGRTYDERVDLFARRHYLHVPEAHHVYRAELGFRSRDGRFAAALRSNEVFAPPEDVSAAMDDQFATLPWNVSLDEGMRQVKVGAPRGDSGERGVPGLAGAPLGASELAARAGGEEKGEEGAGKSRAGGARPTSGEWPTSPGRRSS